MEGGNGNGERKIGRGRGREAREADFVKLSEVWNHTEYGRNR